MVYYSHVDNTVVSSEATVIIPLSFFFLISIINLPQATQHCLFSVSVDSWNGLQILHQFALYTMMNLCPEGT